MERNPIDLVSVAEAAERYNVNPRTIYRLIESGKIRPFRIGTKVVRVDIIQTDALFQGTDNN